MSVFEEQEQVGELPWEQEGSLAQREAVIPLGWVLTEQAFLQLNDKPKNKIQFKKRKL